MKNQPTMGQLMSASHISYADKPGEDEGGFCNECRSKIPDATIGKVNKTTYFIRSQAGQIVLLNPARINKRNVDAIEDRLAALGAGYCVDCRAPHPLSNMAVADEDGSIAEATESFLAPLQ